jgi:hypothetical protein
MIYYLMFVHWIADFICQSNYMATNKSKSNAALTYHILVYTLVLLIMTKFSFTFALINGLSHFCIDYVTSRLSSSQWQKGKVHNFFVVIGFDQMLHVMILIKTMNYL